MSTPKLRARELQKFYNGRKILDIKDLAIEKGELCLIVGPNGAGKTTLLMLLSFLDLPDRGEVYYDGINPNGSKSALLSVRRRLTLVMQRPVIFKTTVFKNVAYGLRVRHLRRGLIREKVTRSLSLVGLSGYEDRNALNLSQGEAQRVALARAIAVEPEVLMLDEPTANLDPANIRTIEDLVRLINRELGTTVVIVTHDMLQVRRLGGHVIFLSKGTIIREEWLPQITPQTPSDLWPDEAIEGEMLNLTTFRGKLGTDYPPDVVERRRGTALKPGPENRPANGAPVFPTL
ncbi:MAG TPA: ATP-binding cassette domain-containing protein [Candidatus Latescibacteria bacterium]|nr:ATP-binding cassette domain-containing protein [Candidatus Latescibacterota bacterium]